MSAESMAPNIVQIIRSAVDRLQDSEAAQLDEAAKTVAALVEALLELQREIHGSPAQPWEKADAALRAEVEAKDARIAEMERLAGIGAEMVGMTTTLDGLDEIELIPQIWKSVADENDLLRAEVEALTAANAALMESVYFARDIAMIMTAKARIPECAEFAKIAQELDAAIAARKGAAKEPTPK